MLGRTLQNPQAGSGGAFIQLNDVPASYAGFKGCTPIVSAGEAGLVFGPRSFPVEMFGAVGDAQFKNDGAMTSGSNVVTASTSAPFAAGDVGKALVIPGAGAAGVQLQGTITSYIGPTQVQISVNASTTVSAQRFVWGTDNTLPFQNAIDAAKSGFGGRVICRSGTPYLITGYLTMNSSLRTPVVLSGDVEGPCTPYNFSTTFPLIYFTNKSNMAIQMGWNTTVQNLAFFYPTQMPLTDTSQTIQPWVFPATIQLRGACTIARCTFINSYDAIGVGTVVNDGGHASRIIDNHVGAFNIGFRLDMTRDVCYFHNNHHWVFYNIFENFWQAFTDQSRWSNFTLDGPCGMEICGADQVIISNFFTLGKQTGLRIKSSPYAQGGLEQSYGIGSNFHFDLACVGIDVTRTNSFGWSFTNIGWTGGDTGGVGGVPPPGGSSGAYYYLVRVAGISRVKVIGGTGGQNKAQSWQIAKQAGTNSKLHAETVINYNPVGLLTSPGVPASGVALLNDFPVSCRVHVAGGTVTEISINGAVTGLMSGVFILEPDETITLTYSAAPTWTWFGL